MNNNRPIRSIPPVGRLLYIALEGVNALSEKTQSLLTGLKEQIQQARRLRSEESLRRLDINANRANAEKRSGATKEKF